MAEIKVNSQFLKSNSENFKKYSRNLSDIMNQLRSELNGARGNWEGQAADAFFNKFNKLAEYFPAYSQKMMEYGNYLDTAATSYTSTERDTTSRVNSASNALRP